jgi:hypothetical protein
MDAMPGMQSSLTVCKTEKDNVVRKKTHTTKVAGR